MTRHLLTFFGIFFMGISQHAYGQHEFFHEVEVEKTLIEHEKWELVGEANWKHLYNEPRWRRWGVSVSGVRNMKRLSFAAGANAYYTFNRSITNFFEVRPWMALQNKVSIIADIAFRHRLKYEWRFFYTEEDPSTKENYGRLRYQIGFDIPIPAEKESSWEIRPFFEWFFIRDPATFERFSNERDYGLTAIKRLKQEHELSLSYKIEEFYDVHTERVYGHAILLAFSF